MEEGRRGDVETQPNPTYGVAKLLRGHRRHSQGLTLLGRLWGRLFGRGAGSLPWWAIFHLRGLWKSWRYLQI